MISKSEVSEFLNVNDAVVNNYETASKKYETCKFNSFYVVDEYVVSGAEKEIISSNVVSDQKEVIMRSNNEIEVVQLSDSNYLLNSSEQTMIIEIVSGEVEVLTSVSRLEPGAMYKLTEHLIKNGVVVLTNYNELEKRNFEYLYDYNTGKRISSGYDTIDEINGKLKVTYGLATGNLDLDGTFVMEADKTTIARPQGFFQKLFNKGKC